MFYKTSFSTFLYFVLPQIKMKILQLRYIKYHTVCKYIYQYSTVIFIHYIDICYGYLENKSSGPQDKIYTESIQVIAILTEVIKINSLKYNFKTK